VIRPTKIKYLQQEQQTITIIYTISQEMEYVQVVLQLFHLWKKPMPNEQKKIAFGLDLIRQGIHILASNVCLNSRNYPNSNAIISKESKFMDFYTFLPQNTILYN